MVPVADLFNHTDMHNVHVEAEDDVCLLCGAPHTGPCSLVPVAIHEANTVNVRCIQPLEAGEEAINTYGDLNNAELLCQYGFVLDSKTIGDRCSWDAVVPAERTELEMAFASVLAYTPDGRVPTTSSALFRQWEPVYAACQRENAEDGVPPPYTLPNGRILDFVPLSPAQRDQHCPLFLDATGRTSWCLWRLCLGAAIVCAERSLAGWDTLLEHVGRAQALCTLVEQDASSPQVNQALASLTHLLATRLAKNYAVDHEAEALPLLQTDRGAARSAAQLALQESDTLHRALVLVSTT